MGSDLKAFLRIRKQFKLKQGVVYRKTQVHDRADSNLFFLIHIDERPWHVAMI